MDVLTALWHGLGFLATPVLAGLLAGALARLVWRRRLAGVRWRRLLGFPVGAAVAAHVAGLLAFGQDGRTATYAAAVLAIAASLAWAGFRGRSGTG